MKRFQVSSILVLIAILLFVCLFVEWKTNHTEINNIKIRLKSGTLSSELFTLPTGINEFDLLYSQGVYHLFYDNKTSSKHRSANTIYELRYSENEVTISGRYPTAYRDDNGDWHIWVYNPQKKRTEHLLSVDNLNTFTFKGDCPTYLADWHVRKNPEDQKFYASYKNIQTLKAGVATAESPTGPWVDLGPIFSEIGPELWHSMEEADAAIFFKESKAFVSFAGWDGHKQRVGLVELNPTTMKALEPALVLVEPTEPWQNRNSQAKIFNPVYIDETHELKQESIFYSHNSDPGTDKAISSGWGYLEARKPLNIVELFYKKIIELVM
ncbi:family 43 glycosylhydrolase [Paenibacillus silviterrae]|uniref:family 43 glycosylhydrolase n=1 Tax=Paenibacillus silviterrae TaxID=3242194 RepID=UPI002543CCD9|nr:family 43 glycosylhydrolase [Paenibacillus chinjuensis]